MNTKLQRDAGMYPARYEGEGRWPHHPDSPDLIDPYEAAYLRGGENAVLTLHLFDLVQRGYLEIVEIKKWMRSVQRLSPAPDPPPHANLTEAEQDLVGRFTVPRQASGTFHFSLPAPLQTACSGYQARFEEAGLFRTQVAATAPWRTLLAFFSAVARLTVKGKAHLKDLQAQFDYLKDRPKTARLGTADPALLTAVGVFGVSVLAGSTYDAFAGVVGPTAGSGWGLGFDIGGDGCGGCGCACS